MQLLALDQASAIRSTALAVGAISAYAVDVRLAEELRRGGRFSGSRSTRADRVVAEHASPPPARFMICRADPLEALQDLARARLARLEDAVDVDRLGPHRADPTIDAAGAVALCDVAADPCEFSP